MKHQRDRERVTLSLSEDSPLDLIASSPIDYSRPLTPSLCDPFTPCVIPPRRTRPARLMFSDVISSIDHSAQTCEGPPYECDCSTLVTEKKEVNT